MAYRQFGDKPLSQPIRVYCQLEPWEQTSVKFQSKYKTFDSWKCSWKYRLPNGGHFVGGHVIKLLKLLYWLERAILRMSLFCYSVIRWWTGQKINHIMTHIRTHQQKCVVITIHPEFLDVRWWPHIFFDKPMYPPKLIVVLKAPYWNGFRVTHVTNITTNHTNVNNLQGSYWMRYSPDTPILTPALFMIYINDLSNICTQMISLFFYE